MWKRIDPKLFHKSDSVQKQSEFNRTEAIIFATLLIIGLTFTIRFGLWWFNLSHISQNFTGVKHLFDYIIFIALTYVVWYQIINELFFWNVARKIKRPIPMKPYKDWKVAFLTAFVPGKESHQILENTLSAMVEADYPHDTWLLDEGDNQQAKEICKKYGVFYFSRKDIKKYNTDGGPFMKKTKGGNYNSWYDQHSNPYELVAQIDVDFIPKKDFLTEMLGYFNDPKVAFVGSPQIYGNQNESWIARAAAEQAFNFYGVTQKGLCADNMSLFIGANHIIRKDSHNHIGGYSGHIVEDHLTGMRIYRKRWKSVYVPKILAIGAGPSTWESYFSQQMRWSYGLIHILFTHSPRLFPRMKLSHIVNYFLLQQYYFYGLAQGIAILLLTLYFVTGIDATTMKFVPLLIYYIPVLLIQFVIALWLQRFHIDPENESGLLLRGRLLNLAAWPVYLTAFFCVLVGKKLTYKVTPKGETPIQPTSLFLFIPHGILGTITLFDVLISVYTHQQAPQLLILSLFNTFIMYGFIGSTILNNIRISFQSARNNSFIIPRLTPSINQAYFR